MTTHDKPHPHPVPPLEGERAGAAHGSDRPPPGDGTGEGTGAGWVSRGGFTLTENASLLRRNTLRVDVHAKWLAEIHDSAAIPALLDESAMRGKPKLLLGEGSNVLFAGDFGGAILTMKTRGIEVLSKDTKASRIRVAAGEHWDGFVRWTLAHGLVGLENLVLIPGSAGAAPMQNIGAYGVEVGEFVESVEAFDLDQGRFVVFINAECAFGYRDSLFKRHPDRWLITNVTLRLPDSHTPRVEYTGLEQELARMGIDPPTPDDIAAAVVNLRTRKLPDPAVIGNAGSFFKNPIVPARQADALRREHPQLPAWPTADGNTKLSAAWLIDACGFKGARDGDAGISDRHALVLVNHGHATGRELWTFARHIRERVKARFNVSLEPEPRIIGVGPR